MNKPGFLEGVVLALILSLLIAALFTILSAFFPTRWLLQSVIAGASFSYILYLLYRSKARTGKVAVVTLWLGFAVVAWIVAPSTLILLFAHVAVIWLIRCLYYHNSILIASLDLGLIVFGMLASLWTLLHTHSLLLAAWVFFLMQALFSVLPQQVFSANTKLAKNQDDGFERAYVSAEAAVRQLSSQS
jgi:hypothetical protein